MRDNMTEITQEIMVRKLEVERLFAGAVFANPNVAIEDCGWITPELLSDSQVRQFWKVFTATKDTTKAALDVGTEFLMDLATMQTAWYGNGLASYAEHIAREAWYYELATKLGPMARALSNDQVDEVVRLSGSFNGRALSSGKQIPDAADVGLDFITDLDNEPRITETGTIIDEISGGLWNSTLTILCARPAIGKTTLAFQIARNISAGGKRVLFSSLEMSSRMLWARATCGVARIPYRDVISRRLDEKTKERLREINVELMEKYGIDLLIDETTGYTTAELWHKLALSRAKVLVVDHIRLFADEGENETRRLGSITWNLKQIAKEFDIPVLALAQLNRQLESRTDKRPALSDLRDSGQIEENADLIFGLHRERLYLEAQTEKSPAELVVMKFRDGPAGFFKKLVFDGLGQWFYDAK